MSRKISAVLSLLEKLWVFFRSLKAWAKAHLNQWLFSTNLTESLQETNCVYEGGLASSQIQEHFPPHSLLLAVVLYSLPPASFFFFIGSFWINGPSTPCCWEAVWGKFTPPVLCQWNNRIASIRGTFSALSIPAEIWYQLWNCAIRYQTPI